MISWDWSLANGILLVPEYRNKGLLVCRLVWWESSKQNSTLANRMVNKLRNDLLRLISHKWYLTCTEMSKQEFTCLSSCLSAIVALTKLDRVCAVGLSCSRVLNLSREFRKERFWNATHVKPFRSIFKLFEMSFKRNVRQTRIYSQLMT
jgi:hypothetical protein